MFDSSLYTLGSSANILTVNKSQNVSGIGLLNKKGCLFCLLNQFVLHTLFIKQETWYFLLDKQKSAPFSFNKQINCAY